MTPHFSLCILVFLSVVGKVYKINNFIYSFMYSLGSFCGGLSTLPAHDLGTLCIKEALGLSGINGENVSEVILGQVLTAGAILSS